MYLISYFFSLFKRNKLRYLACIIGFSVALGSVFTISTYTNMLDTMMNKYFLVDSNSMIVVSKGTTMVQFIPFNSKVHEDIENEIEEIYGILSVVPMIFKNFGNSSTNKYFNDVVVGIDFNVLQLAYLQNSEIDEGNWPESGKNQILIGSKVADGKIHQNDTLLIRNQSYTVSGVLKTDNIMFDHFIFSEFQSVQKAFNMDNYCTMIYIIGNDEVFNDQEKMQKLTDEISNIDTNIQVLNTETLQNASGNFFEFTKLIQFFLAFFPFLISIMFVFILMMLNLKDIEKELGVLRAIGMTSNKTGLIVYFQSFLITLISYFGAIIVGNLLFGLAYISFDLFQRGSDSIWHYIQEMRKITPDSVYINTFFTTLILGILISLIPLIESRKINIVESIKKIN